MTTFTDLPADIVLLIFQIKPFPTNLNKQIYSIYKDSPHFNLFQRIPNFKPITLFHNNLAQYIHLDHPEIIHHGFIYSDLRKVIEKGHLESIKYSIDMIDNIGFQNICNINCMIRARYLYKGFTGNWILMSFSRNIDFLFQHACYTGHLSVAKWRLEYCPEIDISADNEIVFRLACARNHFHTMKWLLKKKPSINISADNEFAFRWACFHTNLSAAKWLLKKKPSINISADNEKAFQYVCEVGHLSLVQLILAHHTIPNISQYIKPNFPPHILDHLASL